MLDRQAGSEGMPVRTLVTKAKARVNVAAATSIHHHDNDARSSSTTTTPAAGGLRGAARLMHGRTDAWWGWGLRCD